MALIEFIERFGLTESQAKEVLTYAIHARDGLITAEEMASHIEATVSPTSPFEHGNS